jgi:predicted O-methyltransferase YrrM
MIYEVDSCTTYDFKSSSMAENRDSLYNLVVDSKPKNVVELGTYYGCSYFAFAQAIKDNSKKLDTVLTGVDSWEGDEHTLFYGEKVYEVFKDLRKQYFNNGRFKSIRGYFKDVVHSFPEESINILLIDGRHNAEDAREDFETYLPKLAKNGLVLFHDIKVAHFTLKDYWSDVSSRYPSHTINNVYGLGILAPKGILNFNKIRL